MYLISMSTRGCLGVAARKLVEGPEFRVSGELFKGLGSGVWSLGFRSNRECSVQEAHPNPREKRLEMIRDCHAECTHASDSAVRDRSGVVCCLGLISGGKNSF